MPQQHNPPKPTRCPDPSCKSRQFGSIQPHFTRAPDGTGWVCWHCGEVIPDYKVANQRPAARQAELWAGA
jgi:hypothetical protein